MSEDQKEQEQEELTVVYNLRSHQVHKSIAAENKKHTKKSHASHRDSQASLETAQQASELAEQLEKLELEVFEEAQTETAQQNLHEETLQAAAAAKIVQPSAPELITNQQLSEL